MAKMLIEQPDLMILDVQLVDPSTPGEVRLNARCEVVDASPAWAVDNILALVARRPDGCQWPGDFGDLVHGVCVSCPSLVTTFRVCCPRLGMRSWPAAM